MLDIKNILFTTTLLMGGIFLSLNVCSQNNLESVLVNISSNNKSIIAYNQYLEAQKTGFKTGLFLSNPTLDYDYMKGTPANAGNQIDISAVQSFDFPTVYGKRKELSIASVDRLGVMEKEFKQKTLLDAKLIFMRLIYLNKFEIELNKRKANAEQMLLAIQEKFDRGDASNIDVNKGKINLSIIQNELRSVIIVINEATQQLIELNGGIEIEVSDTLYPIIETLAATDVLFNEAKKGDYTVQIIQQDKLISERNEQLNKALALPKLEAGYRYQSILGQTFNGFHAGISIPLFEHKNKVQAAKQQSMYFALLEESHMNEHHNELEALYNKANSLKEGIEQYNLLFNNINTEELLSKALQLGEISSIEYFMELRYSYLVIDNYLKQERDYYLVLSELKKYEL